MKKRSIHFPLTSISGALLLTLAQGVTAQTAPTQLPGVVVHAEPEYSEIVQPTFLPDVRQTEIFSGKKATVLDFDALPKVHGNNYRQALALTPGLLYSEESSPLVSIGYRGIGEPHRMQYMQVMKDGIPIHADMLGYPEAYYTPPLDVVDRVEFIRGGGSLMYGPQPGGAFNFVTYMPRADRPFALRSQHVFGSDSLYSTYNAVDGTTGRLGYLAYFNHRQSDGFRHANSDYALYGGSLKLVLDQETDRRWIFNMDVYEEEHGEPGGLSLNSAPGFADYNQDRNQSTRLHDRFRLERYIPSLTYERDFSEETKLSVKSWGGYYSRFSKRQRNSAASNFGSFPTGADASRNDIELQEFYTFGAEARLRHDWEAFGNKHTLAGGVMLYLVDSPRTEQRGQTPDAETGILTRSSNRDVIYGSVFAENRFVFDKLSVTPGFRLENINQKVRTENFSSTTGAFQDSRTRDELEIVPLFGLGVAYQLPKATELYANVSQSYRPVIFTESLVPNPGTVVIGDIEASGGWHYEVGYRGLPTPWLTFDTSLFLIDLDNKLGTARVGATDVLRNVGRTITYGWDAAVELDLIGLYDETASATYGERYGSFSLYGNVSLMHGKIHGGAADGREPQYTPGYILRAGAIYRWQDRAKVALLGTFVDDHFADDSNTTGLSSREIPAYMVWDLTAEVKIYKDHLSLIGGINNLFNEDYYARIRSDGIDPAYGRNYYAGLSFSF
ncbi:MAG: TonB-dependent receptor [Verrucomicrobia bacterium]|nr:TonB-dependent receptor [Verrucomicrobiota bacterium]